MTFIMVDPSELGSRPDMQKGAPEVSIELGDPSGDDVHSCNVDTSATERAAIGGRWGEPSNVSSTQRSASGPDLVAS